MHQRKQRKEKKINKNKKKKEATSGINLLNFISTQKVLRKLYGTKAELFIVLPCI